MHPFLTMAVLIFVGEISFSLPFHITRYFRPTYLDVFNLSNTQLGDIFVIYGIVAMISYFFSGIVADHYSARKLLATSLFTTGLGGIYLAQLPALSELMMLFAYWGFTSIFLFWSALIKATREWGGAVAQGKAFGLLDAGRGLVAAATASIAVFSFERFLIDEVIASSNQQEAMVAVIYFYTILTLLASIIVLVFLKDSPDKSIHHSTSYWKKIFPVVAQRTVWMQAIIVLCAYCGFKGIDYYGLYAVVVLNMSDLESAQFMSQLAYLRPLAAVLAGIIADRITAKKLIMLIFMLLLIPYFGFWVSVDDEFILYTNMIISAALVFALRGIYFALLEEAGTVKNITGISVGVVSVVGFLPDIFFAPVAGRILDASPGEQSFQQYFMLLTAFAILGTLAAFHLRKVIKT